MINLIIAVFGAFAWYLIARKVSKSPAPASKSEPVVETIELDFITREAIKSCFSQAAIVKKHLNSGKVWTRDACYEAYEDCKLLFELSEFLSSCDNSYAVLRIVEQHMRLSLDGGKTFLAMLTSRKD